MTAALGNPMMAVGHHLLADFSQATGLDDREVIETALRDAALAAGAHLLRIELHEFGAGKGITGVALLAESHISIHTWPELAYAALDIFMCGAADPRLALSVLEQRFKPRRTRVSLVERRPA
jgi:S-adenosylmethionine decarboxylase